MNATSDGYLCYLWEKRPEIAGNAVYRGSALSRCIPARLTYLAAAYRTGPFLWSHSRSCRRPSPCRERALNCGN